MGMGKHLSCIFKHNLPLTCCLVFLLLSSYLNFSSREKLQKRPALQKLLTVTPYSNPRGTNFVCALRDQLLAPLSICCCKFRSCKQHLSVKEVLPLELSARFLGAAGLLQLATRQSERLTNSQTGLALSPKNNQVQAVEF